MLPYQNPSPSDSLSVYDSGRSASFVSSAEYAAATEKYGTDDFRFSFIQKYKEHLQGLLGIPVYNCRLERLERGCGFLNFTVYLIGASVRDCFFEETEKLTTDAFFHILAKNPLPALTSSSTVHFSVKNVKAVMYRQILELTLKDIAKTICRDFPEIDSVSSWSELYLFIKEDSFGRLLGDGARLGQIKEYCYKNAKKHDDNSILTPSDFRIRVDNCAHYNSIGGGRYFGSDLMLECPLI
jgi:hypothetical protein